MRRAGLVSTVTMAVLAGSALAADAPRLGVPVNPDIVAAWDGSIFPDGRGLPKGSGDTQQGRAIYDERCSSCHGPEGRGETAEELAGRDPPLTDPDAAQTVGAYWPYATTLFDYIRRAMPMDKPRTLTDDEVYAVSAYLLQINGIIGENTRLDAASLAAIRMPNRDGFVPIDAK
jgi:mono/diheme cytochrome c family protein